jgi:hypothetical protein
MMNEPVCTITRCGDKEWWLNGKLHRENGPAIEFASGYKEWWLNGELHREDGPAILGTYGAKQWWYHGKQLDCNTQEEFERLLKLRAFW